MDQAQAAVPFEVVRVLEIHGRVYVFARLLDRSARFSVSAGTTLGDCQVEPWLEIPRALDERGQQRPDLFAFCLSDQSDQQRLTIHSRVDLRVRKT